MRYYKQINGDYVSAVGANIDGEEITAGEYQAIVETLRNKPTPPVGFDYRLKTDLTWELYELPPEDPDPDLTAEEALDTILGGGEHETI